MSLREQIIAELRKGETLLQLPEDTIRIIKKRNYEKIAIGIEAIIIAELKKGETLLQLTKAIKKDTKPVEKKIKIKE